MILNVLLFNISKTCGNKFVAYWHNGCEYKGEQLRKRIVFETGLEAQTLHQNADGFSVGRFGHQFGNPPLFKQLAKAVVSKPPIVARGIMYWVYKSGCKN